MICRWTGFLGLSIEHADAISRIVDFYDWDVSFEFLRFVDNIWGPHSVDRFAHSHTANCPDSFLVSGILTRRGWMPFVLTGRGRITSSFPQCPLFPGLLGICLYVGPWALLLSLSGSQLHFGPCSLVPIPPFPFALIKRPLFLSMFLIILLRAPQSLFLMVLTFSLMYLPSVCRLVRFVLLGFVSFPQLRVVTLFSLY